MTVKRLSRRDALNLLGLAGLGLISAPGGASALAASWQAGAGAGGVTFPKGAVIRALLRHSARDALGGATLFTSTFDRCAAGARAASEHTAAAAESDKNLTLMIEEARAAAREGVACIVDGGHADMGRDLEFLKQVTTQSGLPIVASGGYYMERVYPRELAAMSEDQIAEELAREAGANRFGAFGEIGENPNAPMSELERKIFRAVGKAHVRTNLPIFTHNAYGTTERSRRRRTPAATY